METLTFAAMLSQQCKCLPLLPICLSYSPFFLQSHQSICVWITGSYNNKSINQMDSLWIVITYYLLALNSTKCLLFLMPASFLLLKEKNDVHFAGRKLEEPFF